MTNFSDQPPSRVTKNIEKVARDLFSDDESVCRFLDAVGRGESGASAVVWLREPHHPSGFATDARPEWLPDWMDAVAAGERPGRSEAHDAGEIYCLDLSSTFACAAVSAIQAPVRIIVDVCASPGGKGIVARRYLNSQLLVGNEVIGKRTAQLISNYKRCRIDPSMVTSVDPEVLGREIPHTAELVIVDAPCSGQSLMLKGMAAPGAFHPATIGMNERRQRRILANSARVVAHGGYLLYSTCTFSREENEDNVEWFLRKFPDFSAVAVPILESYRSSLSAVVSYRLFPHHGKGAGAFCALLQRGGAPDNGWQTSPDTVVARLKSVWRSPALFVSRDEKPIDSTTQRKKRPYKRDERENSRKERRESKRMTRQMKGE